MVPRPRLWNFLPHRALPVFPPGPAVETISSTGSGQGVTFSLQNPEPSGFADFQI